MQSSPCQWCIHGSWVQCRITNHLKVRKCLDWMANNRLGIQKDASHFLTQRVQLSFCSFELDLIHDRKETAWNCRNHCLFRPHVCVINSIDYWVREKADNETDIARPVMDGHWPGWWCLVHQILSFYVLLLDATSSCRRCARNRSSKRYGSQLVWYHTLDPGRKDPLDDWSYRRSTHCIAYSQILVFYCLWFVSIGFFQHLIVHLEQIRLIVGRTAEPEFIQILTYIALTHDPRVLQVDTVKAYHAGSTFFVEVDIVLPPGMELQEAHDIGESLQVKLELLPEVERAFVHLDYETSHVPEHRKTK